MNDLMVCTCRWNMHAIKWNCSRCIIKISKIYHFVGEVRRHAWVFRTIGGYLFVSSYSRQLHSHGRFSCSKLKLMSPLVSVGPEMLANWLYIDEQLEQRKQIFLCLNLALFERSFFSMVFAVAAQFSSTSAIWLLPTEVNAFNKMLDSAPFTWRFIVICI